jgi:ABC-type phosphate/phosphonate transport system substrate-binding protein
VIASFRMYEAVPAAAAAWRALFTRVFADLGLDIRVIEHRFPDPIEALWREPELCCAFMCGWPFARAQGMQAIAAPVPSARRYEDLPRYCSDYVARDESGWTRLEDSFGHRIGWMTDGSHSGFNAPRAHLAGFVSARRPRLFAESVGPLGTPARVLDAVRTAVVDVAPVDGFYLDLVRHHEPARLEGLRVIASTPWAPIPPLVAAPGIDAQVVGRLREHLAALHESPAHAALLEPVLLARFVVPDIRAYAETERLRERAERAGYAAIR